jgi:hypothetical protein
MYVSDQLLDRSIKVCKGPYAGAIGWIRMVYLDVYVMVVVELRNGTLRSLTINDVLLGDADELARTTDP